MSCRNFCLEPTVGNTAQVQNTNTQVNNGEDREREEKRKRLSEALSRLGIGFAMY